MGFWDGSDELTDEQLAEVSYFEVCSSPELHVEVLAQEFDTPQGIVRCWTYVSDGMLRYGQKEIALSIERSSDEIPTDPFQFFQLIWPHAQNGNLVDFGGLTEFGPGGAFGVPNIRGLGYAHAQHLEEVCIRRKLGIESFLHAIPLVDDELAFAKYYGLSRVLTRLGYVSRYFPYPTWISLERKSAFDSNELTETFLSETGGAVVLPHAKVHYESNHVILEVAEFSTDYLFRVLQASSGAVVFSTEVGIPGVKHYLVWIPDSSHPVGITCGGASAMTTLPDGMTGTFVAITGDTPGGQGANIVEDGFGVFLTPALWDDFCDAVKHRQNFKTLGTEGLFSFSLVWRRANQQMH